MITTVGVTDVSVDFPVYNDSTNEDMLLSSRVNVSFQPVQGVSSFPILTREHIKSKITQRFDIMGLSTEEFLRELCQDYGATSCYLSTLFLFPYEGNEYFVELAFEFRKDRLKKSVMSIRFPSGQDLDVEVKVNFTTIVLIEDVIETTLHAINSSFGKLYSYINDTLSEQLPAIEGVEWYCVTTKHPLIGATLVSERKVSKRG